MREGRGAWTRGGCAGGSTTPPYRSLCQPYVEVFVNRGKVHTSVSKGNLREIRQFKPADKWVEVALGVVVKGNVVVCVHHVRSVSADGTVRRGVCGRSCVVGELLVMCCVSCCRVLLVLRCFRSSSTLDLWTLGPRNWSLAGAPNL